MALIELARPHHWVKGAFVLVPVPFAWASGAGAPAAPLSWASLALGLAGFSLLTSAVYTLNDLADAETDRLHPEKRTRPIARGRVSPAAAGAFAAALLLGGGALLWLAERPAAAWIAAGYLVANAAYSLGLKHVVTIDVFALASFYLLRVLLGCALVEAAPSSWLLSCAGALALFLALAKRRADLSVGVGADHRGALAGYSVPFLDHGMAIAAGAALISYALYCQEAQVLVPGRELAGVPFVAFALLETLRCAYAEGSIGSPVDLALRSLPLQLCGLGWVAATAWSLGLL